MKKLLALLLVLPAVFLPAASGAQEAPEIRDKAPLRLVGKIALPNARGRLDDLDIDLKRGRLFVAVPGNDTIEVVDIKNNRPLNRLTLINGPQGVLYIPYYDRLVVTSASDGTCKFYDGNTYNLIASFSFDENAGCLYYDPVYEHIYVGYGYGGIGVISREYMRPIGGISLWGHPEAFQLDYKTYMMFVNIPSLDEIEVIDLMMGVQVESIPLKNMKDNYPMALDEAGRRLFVGTRSPPNLVVFDADSHSEVAAVGISKDAGSISYDRPRGYIYVSAAEGYIDVIRRNGPDGYELVAKIETAPGARASLFVPETGRLYLAVPEHGSQPASIWVYEADRLSLPKTDIGI